MIAPYKIFEAKLTGLFASVEPKFQEATVNRYLSIARGNYKSYMDMLSGPKPERINYRALDAPQYVSWKGGMSCDWDGRVRAAQAGLFYCDEKRATDDAMMSVRRAREHFIFKHSKKLANATKLRTDRPTISGTLRFNVSVQGVLVVSYANGDKFDIVMSMIVNSRSSMRGYTSFYQFPARFSNVQLGGQTVKSRVSEQWMSENFK